MGEGSMAIADDYTEVNGAMIDTFGQAITFTPNGGAAASKSAVLQAGDDVETLTPGVLIEAFVQLSDFTADPTEYDTVTISAAVLATVGIESATALTFAIREMRHDSFGGAKLGLQVQR